MVDEELNPQAYFDCLAVLASAPSSVSPLTRRELHLFAYLACLLSVFEGEPTANWGYQFALTSRGYPHSPSYEAAFEALIQSGFVCAADAGTFSLTTRGVAEFDNLNDLYAFAGRMRWLTAATDCSLALPVGAIRLALTSRDELLAAAGSGQPRSLITPAYVERIHDERVLIEKTLGGESLDLMAPAVAWLSLYVLRAQDQIAA